MINQLRATVSHIAPVIGAELDIRGLNPLVSDGTRAADGLALNANKQPTDAVAADDIQALSTLKALEDGTAGNDQFNRTAAFVRALDDAASGSDAFDRTVDFVRTLQDTAEVVDALIGGTPTARVSLDSAAATDALTQMLSKLLTDAVTVVDALTTGTPSGAPPSAPRGALADASAASDNGSLFYQGYGSSDYFAGDYVGTVTSFSNSGISAAGFSQGYGSSDYFAGDYVGIFTNP